MFSRKPVRLVEAFIAVGMLALVATVVAPRWGAASPAPRLDAAAPDAALRQSLQVWRVAIESYYLDHGVFPGQTGDGQNPAGSAAAVVAQLTAFSDETGHVSTMPLGPYRFGPYLRRGVPACPVPPREGLRGVWVTRGSASPGFVGEASDAGWIYNCDTGEVAVNSNGADAAGRVYLNY